MLKKTLKVISIILLIVAILGFVSYQYFLKAVYVPLPDLKGELLTETIVVDGHQRTFQWYNPSNQQVNSLLFVLHGSTGDGPGIRQQTGYSFDQLAEKEGFVPVYPTGYFNHWNDCRGTADYQANVDNIDDIRFLQQIETHIAQKLGNTFKHIFATGHSNGGHFCFKLAFEAPDWIDGIAAISANIPIKENLDCIQSGRFVPLFLINGTADNVNPYNGGLVEILGNTSRGTVMSTDETMAYWASLADCREAPTKQAITDKNTSDNSYIEQYNWTCQNAPSLQLFKVVDGGHTIPHTQNRLPRILGVTNQDVNAAEAIWQFFDDVK